MLPHQFKRLLETLRSQFSAIQEAIQNYQNSDANEHSADRGEKRIETGTLREISNRVNPDHPTTTSRYEQTGGQQERLITAQVWMTRWTFCAFVAAGLTAIGAFWYACIANRQLGKMDETYREMRWQSHYSCLNAQAAQDAFNQLQLAAADTHAAAAASVEQAAAVIESERAYITFEFRFPAASEVFNNELDLPFIVRNEGKSTTSDLNGAFSAVLLGESEPLKINPNPSFRPLSPNYRLIGGQEVPGKADPKYPQFLPGTPIIAVYDSAGKTIPESSKRAIEYMTGGGSDMVFVSGHFMYSDFAGKHWVKYCHPVYASRLGTVHHTTNKEIQCENYNSEKDDYVGLPKIGAAPPPSVKPSQRMDCPAPE